MLKATILTASLSAFILPALAENHNHGDQMAMRTPAPEGADVYLISPADGATE